IRRLENDIITTPFHGKFRFLMGDDKSTWFHLLAQGSRMLYAPDALCYSLESRDADFWEISRSLSYRWYGNTLRNSMRALALGPRRIGSFYIWWAILDQRISMWTSLVGLAGASTLAVFQSIHYLIFYIGWLIFVRLFQITVITLGGHPVTWRTIPLMLYSQWVGAFVKIKALYHLNDQSWSKGGVEQTANDGFAPIRHPLFPYIPDAMMITSYILFVFIILVTHHALEIPDPSLLLADDYLSPEREKVVDAAAHGIVPNDGKDDATALQTLIDTLPSFSVLQLPAGTIDLYRPVTIRRDDLTIRGKGSNRTLLLSHIRGEGQAVLLIEGRRLAKTGMLQEDAHPGDGSIHIDFFKFPGTRWLLLRQPNDPAFLRRLGATRWHKRYPYLRQEILPAVRYEKKETVLANRLLTPFHKRSTEVFALAPVTGVTLRDFSMRQQIPGHRSQEVICRYQNLFPDYRVDLIRLKWAARCRIEHLHLQNAGRHPIDLDSCYGIQIGHIFIDGAWNKGKKGNGYLRLARTFHSILDHVTVRRIRHLTLQWSSAGNLLKTLDLGVDLNFHGGYSHDNTVTRVTFRIPPCHPWQKGITRTPSNAEWAPPDGPNNRVESIRFIKFR
ncbi:MAG: glycosyltransferase, partial [Epsilonproteobacteria bacterium]|nr:glycosyltransferase [Campylobacterota bacterium]